MPIDAEAAAAVQSPSPSTPTAIGAPDPWPLLGLVRFFLACVVMFAHADVFIEVNPLCHWAQFFDPRVAVICFLVVSGYSIGDSIGRGDTAEFYFRRARRILPLYWASLAWTILTFVPEICAAIANHHPIPTMDSLAAWIGAPLMLQQFVTPNLGANTSIWSLSLEWAYYAVAPALARMAWPLLTALTALSLAISAHWPHARIPLFQYNATLLLTLAWAWIGGFAISRGRHPAAAVFVTLLGAGLVWREYGPAPAVMLGATILAAGLAWRLAPLPSKLRRAALYLGDLSYPIYLFHEPTLVQCSHIWPGLPPAIALLAAAAVSATAERTIDRPARRLPMSALTGWMRGRQGRSG